MGYGIDLVGAARRYFSAAQKLDSTDRGVPCPHYPVAGYLYGIAAECSLKAIMEKSGIPKQPNNRKEDPYFAHFPELKSMLRDRISGRYASLLRTYAEDSSLLNEWDVKMRYAPSSDIEMRQVERWRTQAQRLLNEMEAS